MTSEDEIENQNEMPCTSSAATASILNPVQIVPEEKKIKDDNSKSDDGKAKNQKSKKHEQGRLSQKLALLNEKTKSLRDKLGFSRRELHHQQLMVQHSEETREQNDELAAHAMVTLEANATYTFDTLVKPVLDAHTMATLAVNEAEVRNEGCASEYSTSETLSSHQSLVLSNQKGKARSRHGKTRVTLLEQVEGLQELLEQLAARNPQLQEQVRQLARQNPKLRKLKIFQKATTKSTDLSATSSGNRQQPHQQPIGSRALVKAQCILKSSPGLLSGPHPVHKRLQAGGLKTRHVSERSNASSINSQNETLDATAVVPNSGKRVRKNKRNKKNKSSQPAKCQASEEEALAKYINMIVSEYVGDKENNATELEFKGGVDELEAYAQRLVQAGLGRVVEEEIRVNRKNNRQSFITMSNDREGTERDGIILLPIARRYAFEGDTVRAFVMNTGSNSTVGNDAIASAAIEHKKIQSLENTITGGKEHSFSIADDEDPFANEDSDMEANELDTSAVVMSDNCPKAFVISIVKHTDLREVVGTISFKNATKLYDECAFYKLKPHDMRMPMVYIPEDSCEAHITEEKKNDICGFLYLAQVREIDANGHCIGELLQPVGKVGNLEAEMKAILVHNGLKSIRPYEERFNDMYAQTDMLILEQDLRQREDLRSICIFTIDPMTARDLDDAMSVERVTEDQYDVGVHISDVSHFLQEDSELDNIVKDRTTSIYLINEVIHMLPQPLCFICSLLPGEDKFTFSVFWRMNLKGEILGKPRFTRSIINSCSQFSYEHAQKIIDNPAENFGINDFPTICNNFMPADIEWRVCILHTIAQKMRQKRYDAGALSINNPKLHFNLDPKTGEPLSYEVDDRQEANFLIEEFMLLANQSVARFIYERFPDTAILRNHAPPLAKSMKALREKLNNFGIEFDCNSSKTVYESMQRICREAQDPKAMDACLSTLLTKPMARAKYFCSEGKTEESDLWHYALSIPIYTHFTSPIRRYPDILVHRLLAAALNYCAPPKRTTEELHYITKVCNDQKFNAKNAGDESINLFFKRYIRAKQYILLRAVITEIFQHLTNVVTIETGHVIAINYKMQKVLVDTSNVPAYLLISEKNSKNMPVKLQLFSTVDVKLVVWDGRICGFFTSPDPKQRQMNSIESSKKKQQKANVASNSNSENCLRKARQNSQSNGISEHPVQFPDQSNSTKSQIKCTPKTHQERN